MKEIDEYYTRYMMNDTVETELQAFAEIAQEIANDVREECAKECEKVAKSNTCHGVGFDFCHNHDIETIRNLKLFEEL